MTDPSPLEQAAARIDGLVDRGAHICGAFNPEGETLHCHRCGYPADTHLIRDLRLALEARTQEHEALKKAAISWMDGEPGFPCGCGHDVDTHGVAVTFYARCEHHIALQAAKDAAEARVQAQDRLLVLRWDVVKRLHRQLADLHAALQGLAQQMREGANTRDPDVSLEAQVHEWAESLEALVRPTSRVEKAATYQIHPRDREPVEPTEPQKEG